MSLKRHIIVMNITGSLNKFSGVFSVRPLILGVTIALSCTSCGFQKNSDDNQTQIDDTEINKTQLSIEKNKQKPETSNLNEKNNTKPQAADTEPHLNSENTSADSKSASDSVNVIASNQPSLDGVEHNITSNHTNPNEEDAKLNPNKSNKPVQTQVAIIDCDDQLALTQLIQMVRENIRKKSNFAYNQYVDRVKISPELANTDDSVSAMLIDVANPKPISKPNAQGKITCNASLSVTLPTKDVYRVTNIYNALGNKSLSRELQSKKISLNNNMLVTNVFTYIVGIENGQTITRMVGEPTMFSAVADIISKSQFQLAADNSLPSSVNKTGEERLDTQNKIQDNGIDSKANTNKNANSQQPAKDTEKNEGKRDEGLSSKDSKDSQNLDSHQLKDNISVPSGNAQIEINPKSDLASDEAANKSQADKPQ